VDSPAFREMWERASWIVKSRESDLTPFGRFWKTRSSTPVMLTKLVSFSMFFEVGSSLLVNEPEYRD